MSFSMPVRVTVSPSTPRIRVIPRKHKCITSLQGHSESLEARKKANWEGDLSPSLRRGMDKDPGDTGPGRKKTC